MCPDPDSRIAHFNILEGKTPFKQALWIAWGVVCGIFLSMDILVPSRLFPAGCTRAINSMHIISAGNETAETRNISDLFHIPTPPCISA
jgi:hypothetical protein